jgi:hypothetical protein
MAGDKKEFTRGLVLFIGFCAVLLAIFMPLFGGKNALNYMDDLYNSISKGSAYYIPKLKEETKAFDGNRISAELEMLSELQAKETVALFKAAGAMAAFSGEKMKVSGDLGKIMANCLEDSDNLFQNNGDALKAKYSYNERRVLYNWWQALKEMDKDLKKQKKFKEAAFIANASKKGVECAYNYYGVEPQKITERMGIVLFSLAFYVIYTMWYGFSIMFMFEGWGLKLEH